MLRRLRSRLIRWLNCEASTLITRAEARALYEDACSRRDNRDIRRCYDILRDATHRELRGAR